MLLERRAGIESRADLSGELLAARQRRGAVQGSVAAEELRAIRGPCRLPPRHVGERDAPAEFLVPRVAHEEGAGLPVQFGDEERRGRAARGPEHPLDVSRHGQPPRPVRAVAQPEPRDLRRRRRSARTGSARARCHGSRARKRCNPARAGSRRAIPRVSAAGSAPRSPRSPRRARRAYRRKGRTPGRWTRGQLVQTAVFGPNKAGARLRDLKTELRRRDDVDPRSRRPLAFAEHGHVLPALRLRSPRGR